METNFSAKCRKFATESVHSDRPQQPKFSPLRNAAFITVELGSRLVNDLIIVMSKSGMKTFSLNGSKLFYESNLRAQQYNFMNLAQGKVQVVIIERNPHGLLWVEDRKYMLRAHKPIGTN